MKPRRPDIIDRLEAKAAQPTVPQVNGQDLANVLTVARLALPQLRGQQLVIASVSMANLEAIVAALPQAQPVPAAAPANEAPAAAPAEAKKG